MIGRDSVSLVDRELRSALSPGAVRAGPVVVLVVALLVAAWRLGLLLSSARYGIDFTDEGYYLVWIADPFAYSESVTQFGFIYHPLYVLLGGDIARIRQGNILITFVLAWMLTGVFFRSVLAETWPRAYWRSWPMLSIAAVLATTYPNLLNVWLPTPSYNSLALQALLLTGAGLLLTDRSFSWSGVAGPLLVGLGGWLAFMAKPSTGGAAALIAFLYMWGAGKLNLRTLVLSAVTAMVLLAGSAWVIDGSLARFAARLSGAVELSRLMGVQQTMWRLFRIDGFSLDGADTALFALVAAAVAFCTMAWSSPGSRWFFAALLLLLGMSLTGLAITTGVLSVGLAKGRFQGVVAGAAPIGAVVAAFLMARTRWEGEFARGHLSAALCLAMFPYAFAFGSGNNYWQTGQGAGLFWVLSGLAVLGAAVSPPANWRVFLPVAIGSQLVAVVLLQIALDHPYRQPQALRMGEHAVVLGEPPSELMLERDYARYVVTIRDLAHKAGFQPHMPMIDMTGHSPGTLFSLGARSTGQAWLLGGYGGSDRSARHALSRVACSELAVAWLLMEPSGPRKLSFDILLGSGIDTRRDFELVGTLRSPDGFGDYAAGSEQQLLKPLRPAPDATLACERARKVGR